MMEADKRKWHVSKEIPVALIISMAGALFLGGVAYQSLQGNQEKTNEAVAQIRDEQKEMRLEFKNITRQINESNVPSALTQRRLDDLERERATAAADRQQTQTMMMQLTARVAENERKLASETMRNRAARSER